MKWVSLPAVASIYTAELIAIQLNLDMIDNSSQTEFIVTSDAFTAIKTIRNTAKTRRVSWCRGLGSALGSTLVRSYGKAIE